MRIVESRMVTGPPITITSYVDIDELAEELEPYLLEYISEHEPLLLLAQLTIGEAA